MLDLLKINTTNDLNNPTYRDGLAIRKDVFVNEQGVPPDLEVDADEANATYLTGHDETGTAQATLRLLPEGDGLHVQRVAVRSAARGRGYGREMMTAAIAVGQKQHAQFLVLGAQVHACGFYTKMGFTYTDRPQFDDAGIPHREMIYRYE